MTEQDAVVGGLMPKPVYLRLRNCPARPGTYGCLVEVHHHLSDAALGGRNPALVEAEPELLAKRGLHALAVEKLAFDFGGLQRFVADQLDLEDIPVC
jgi:hypothetical protein